MIVIVIVIVREVRGWRGEMARRELGKTPSMGMMVVEAGGRVIATWIRHIWGGRKWAREDRIWGGIVNFAWDIRRNMAMDEVFSPHIL